MKGARAPRPPQDCRGLWRAVDEQPGSFARESSFLAAGETPALLSLVWLLLLLAFLSPAAAQTPTAADTDTSPTAQRIISCVPNLTEILFALGVGDQVVGVSTYTTYPPAATKLPQVIDLFNPSLEAALALRPTLVVGYTSHEKVLGFFAGQPAIRTLKLEPVETLAQIDGAILRLGRELGREAEARRIVAGLPRPHPGSHPTPGPKVLVVVGSGPSLSQLYVAGHGTYLNELIEGAGARNAVGPEMGKYPALSKEALLQIDPDIVLSVAEPDVVAEKYALMKREWGLLRTLRVVKAGDFRFVTDPGIMLPGPRSAGYLPVLESLIWEGSPGAAKP